MSNEIKKMNYVVLVEAVHSNPNGDPDNDNAPRMDPDTEYGIISNQCLNRKIRNQVLLRMPGVEGYDIYIQTDRTLNDKSAEAYNELALNSKAAEKGSKLENVAAAQKFMLKKYFDIRAFGAVLSTGNFDAGRVTGAVQTSFARSVHPITIQEISLTRQAFTSNDRFEKNASNEMGRKQIVPYGLYVFYVSISAVQAAKNGFTAEDLKVYETALINMFENDESSCRNSMSVRGIFRFTHEHELGNAPFWKLKELVHIDSKVDYPRQFNDFDICVDEAAIPEGITMDKLV